MLFHNIKYHHVLFLSLTISLSFLIVSCEGLVSGSGGSGGSGGCRNASDRASDGSRCGGRASNVRPGGR